MVPAVKVGDGAIIAARAVVANSYEKGVYLVADRPF
jgi:acetyltransferase-like isoleucine patch superfamily enzyme